MQPRSPAAYSLVMTRFVNRSKTCGAVLIGCVLILSAALVGSSCSSTADSSSSASSTSPPSTTTSPKVPDQADCVPPAASSPVQVTAVAGSATDIDLVSFDGTVIRGHWFALPSATAQDPAPTILMGPGWSLSGDTAVDSVGILGWRESPWHRNLKQAQPWQLRSLQLLLKPFACSKILRLAHSSYSLAPI